MSIRIVFALLLGTVTVAWAGPANDLISCQAQTAVLTQQVQQAQQARIGYVVRLAEMLAETREQLDQTRAQLQAIMQEVARLKAVKPEAKP